MKYYGIFLGLIGGVCQAQYILVSSVCENKIAVLHIERQGVMFDGQVVNVDSYNTEYLSFEKACAIGICDGDTILVQEAIKMAQQQRTPFVVESILQEFDYLASVHKPWPVTAGILACASAGFGIAALWQIPIDKVGVGAFGALGLIAGALAYVANYPGHKAVTRKIFEKLITLDSALFVIKDNVAALSKWGVIKESIDDQQLITKVEHFLHLT